MMQVYAVHDLAGYLFGQAAVGGVMKRLLALVDLERFAYALFLQDMSLWFEVLVADMLGEMKNNIRRLLTRGMGKQWSRTSKTVQTFLVLICMFFAYMWLYPSNKSIELLGPGQTGPVQFGK